MSDKTAYAGDARSGHGGDLSPLEAIETCIDHQTQYKHLVQVKRRVPESTQCQSRIH